MGGETIIDPIQGLENDYKKRLGDKGFDYKSQIKKYENLTI